MTGSSNGGLFVLLLLLVATGSGFGYLLYYEANVVNTLRHIELSKCTVLDAQAIMYQGSPRWVIHVNFTVPPAHNLPPNTTGVSVLEGTNQNDHYFVNQTFPCYASTADLEYVALTPQKPDGLAIISLVFLPIMCLVILIVILSLIFSMCVETFRTSRRQTKSAVEMVEQRGLTRVETRTSFDSNPSDLEEAPLTS